MCCHEAKGVLCCCGAYTEAGQCSSRQETLALPRSAQRSRVDLIIFLLKSQHRSGMVQDFIVNRLTTYASSTHAPCQCNICQCICHTLVLRLRPGALASTNREDQGDRMSISWPSLTIPCIHEPVSAARMLAESSAPEKYTCHRQQRILAFEVLQMLFVACRGSVSTFHVKHPDILIQPAQSPLPDI